MVMIEIAKAFAHGVMSGCNIEDVHVADEWYGGEYFDVNVFGSYWGDFDDPYALKVVVYKVVDGEIQLEQELYTAFLLRDNGWQEVA
jgi:hypothetical protein